MIFSEPQKSTNFYRFKSELRKSIMYAVTQKMANLLHT
nr:MAG TPA: hypothetical protein [Caudoviricetes sp.]